MATSQFRIFRSTDPGAPALYGTTGSLITVIDHCLITGSGWVKKFPNTSSFVANPTANSLGCWQQPTGSSTSGSAGMTLFVNDGAPHGAALYKEAWAVGWENLLGLSASVSMSVGSGSGQFPLPAQLSASLGGHITIRKSATSDGTNARFWLAAADSSSFYLFIGTGDTANTYYGFGFGDIYSFKSGSNDAYRCIIMGRNTDNATVAASEGMDLFSATMTVGTTGNYLARNFAASGSGCITASRHGDGIKGSTTTLLGNILWPNGPDMALYTSPIWITEGSNIRGQLRGLHQLLHPIAAFSDLTTFSGSIDYDGRTFLLLKQSVNAGIYVIETSNTVLTNTV